MLIIGASGHARVIIDIIHKLNLSIKYIVDADPDIMEIENYEVLHKVSDAMKKHTAVIGIGNNHTRYKIVREKTIENFAKPIVHPDAVVAENLKMGEGSVVMAGAVINPAAVIGKHCIINTSSIVEHEVVLEDFVHVSPGTVLTGNVKVGEGAHIGAGAVIIPGITVGKWATVGAGAVVIDDVPDFAVVVGNPGRIIKYNKCENE
ncbi:acetyltransferase [Christiangramia fulva]|uniref:Acetyltransferase n=1 Tax=Christiangramia fulva TaxID=2126553 RepID=A0A2R3Z9M2_9FLAO|nr:acetyltransferase [Christiangramia fulva]AVR46884.1 acetyltransferase [Christiangramia fulva]